jgi:hypothetical protein
MAFFLELEVLKGNAAAGSGGQGHRWAMGFGHPHQALFTGIAVGRVFGKEAALETHDAVGRGTAAPAANGNAGSVQAVGKSLGERRNEIFADGDGMIIGFDVNGVTAAAGATARDYKNGTPNARFPRVPAGLAAKRRSPGTTAAGRGDRGKIGTGGAICLEKGFEAGARGRSTRLQGLTSGSAAENPLHVERVKIRKVANAIEGFYHSGGLGRFSLAEIPTFRGPGSPNKLRSS